MTIRNLDYLFKPKSVAVIGASNRDGSLGAVLTRNLVQGGLDGPVMPVNPKYAHVQSIAAYADITSLPVAPDLAVIATPPATVPQLIADLGARGTRAAIVISAGFSGNPEAAGLKQAMLDSARPHLLRIVGPNCLGVMAPPAGLNASFSHLPPLSGNIAFVTHSGAIVTSIIDWATGRGIGFSHIVSLGDMSDVDFGDMLDYLASDEGTDAILLYVEAVTHPRKFMTAARAAARSKPVIVIKSGRFSESAKAAASHTGALAGADEVYDAAFRRAGMLRVFQLEELFDAAETLSKAGLPERDRLTILTNGGGMGVIATDTLMATGGHLAELPESVIAALDKVLPPTWSRSNPVDIIGDAPGTRYADALRILLEDGDQDALLILNSPTAVASATDAATAVIDTLHGRQGQTVLTSWIGGESTRPAREMFSVHNVPTYETPSQAVAAFMHLVTYRRNQENLMETPPAAPAEIDPDIGRARQLIATALSEKRSWMTAIEAKQMLAAYGLPVAATLAAETPEDAAEAALEIDAPVALKILSADITHKTDVGGVILGLDGAEAVRAAATAMLEQVRKARPDARIDGFMIEEMIRRPGAYELIAGMSTDKQFGPVILFGQGGTSVEITKDKALGLPPLNLHLANDMIEQTRVWNLLKGFRGLPPVDLEAVAMTLIRISRMIVDFPQILEIDINPLLADSQGVIALDARIRVEPTTISGEDRLAIRPYPAELEETIERQGDSPLLLRPIVPEDEPSLQKAFAGLTPEETRLRFAGLLKALPHVQAARFTQIDYDREMALVLTEPGAPGTTEIFGVVRIHADPDNEQAEYAIIIRKAMSGNGYGTLLMKRIVEYARARGTGSIFGYVLSENTPMLDLCAELGFLRTALPEDSSVMKLTLDLRAT
jgi:acetyltransferase